MDAIIKGGRWVARDESPLDPIQLNQVSQEFNRIHEFTKGVAPLTHDRITILSAILKATPNQEKAIISILKLGDKEIEELLK